MPGTLTRRSIWAKAVGFLLPVALGLGFLIPLAESDQAHASGSLPATTVRGIGLYEMSRFIGKYSFATDGLASATGSGTLSIQKPANATVEAAYLTIASRLNATPVNPVATLSGSSVTFTHRSGGADNSSVRNWLADVTSIVKPGIDAASTGQVDISATYNYSGATAYTGVGLTVIFSDPNVIDGTTIFQFGHSNPAGDSTTLSFNAIGTVPTEAPLSLGVAWSIQGSMPVDGTNPCGYSGETSCVDITTSSNQASRRLTAFAGGPDDTVGSIGTGNDNYALVTVGGFGDSTSNPSGSWSSIRSDDELYNVASYLSAGDTSLTLSTRNPSGNDSIFQLVISIPGVLANETVSFDANSGTGSMNSITRSSSAALPANTFEREGWVFDGWNTSADGSGTDYANGATYPYTSSATLYAQWIAAPGAPSSLTGRAATTDGSVTLSWTAPTNNGSAITGYTVEKRVSGTSTWSSATDSDGNATNAAATISGLGSCVAYDFRVAATNAVGTGSFSSTASVTSFGSTGLTGFDESDFILTGGKQSGRSNARPAGEVWSAEVTGSGVSQEVVLNEPFLWEFGAAWSGSRFDLAESFCVEADVFLGDEDAPQSEGADGIAFVLQPNDTAQGTAGGGLGYAGITPSFAVEYDTYWNPTEDSYSLRTGFELNDHMGLVLGGNADVHTAGSTTPTRVVDLEDEQWRATQIRWDADQRLLTVKLDQDADGIWDAEDTIYNNVSVNLASTFASSNGLAYWGFTGSTGGLGNYQKLRNLSYSPATLAGNTEPTVSNSGSQSVAVGSSQTINLVLADNNETSQGQWRLSVTVGNSSAATATVSATSATAATVTVNGLINADTTVTVTAVDADGASAASAFALRVGTGTPSTQQNSNQRQNNQPVTPIVTPNVPGQPRLPLPPSPTTNPQALPAPPQTQNTTSGPIDQPRALVGGVPAPVTTTQNGNSQLNVQTGSVQLGVLAGGGGSVQQNPQTNQPELRVPSGGSTSFTGGGLLPGSTLQVWLPGATNRELGRLPVAPDGTFQGEVRLSQPQGQPPLPIGRQVLQVTGFDANGNQTIVDMPVNIAQGPPTPEVNRELGLIPTLTPGQSLATSAGQPVAVNVIPFQSQNSVAVEGDGWNFSVNVEGGSGEVGGTPESPLIQFTQSGTGSVSGGGFLPETVASVWLFSDPTLLGTVTVAEDGSFTAEFLVDSQFIPTGEHTLQVQGVGEDGYIKAANLGVLVQEPAVATTASSAGTLLWWGLGALLVLAIAVAIVMIIARRKQA